MTSLHSYSTPGPIAVCDKETTASLLDFRELVRAIAQASAEYQRGEIMSPERQVLPLGAGGVLLSMPATAADIGIHKLVNVQPANAARGVATIQGIVSVCDAATGTPRLLLEGPEVTGRRTAAVSLLAIERLLPAPPRAVLLVGTGMQALHHLRGLAALYPDCLIHVRGTRLAQAEAFCDSHRAVHQDLRACRPGETPAMLDAVITLTTATSPVYDEPGRAGLLVIGVGAFKPEMAEIGARTLADSVLYADDPEGARHEAGDLLRAGVDWGRVMPLARALDGQPDLSRPIVFKSVGTAAWDLAAARVALARLSAANR